MELTHQSYILRLVTRVRKEMPEKDIWLYSGYTMEELLNGSVATETALEILKCVDVLVDGEFIQDLKDQEIPFRGSRNQRLLDMRPFRIGKQPVSLVL